MSSAIAQAQIEKTNNQLSTLKGKARVLAGRWTTNYNISDELLKCFKNLDNKTAAYMFKTIGENLECEEESEYIADVIEEFVEYEDNGEGDCKLIDETGLFDCVWQFINNKLENTKYKNIDITAMTECCIRMYCDSNDIIDIIE